eukprot:scaffold3452_cov140-Alexandrium_tamarense.AAC.1
MDHRDSSVASPLASATREVSRNMSAVKKDKQLHCLAVRASFVFLLLSLRNVVAPGNTRGLEPYKVIINPSLRVSCSSKSRGNDKSDVSISALATALDWMHQGYHSIEFELFVAAVNVTPNNTRNKLVSHQVFGGVSRRLNATETTSPTTVVTSSTSKAPVSASPTKNPLTAPPTVK